MKIPFICAHGLSRRTGSSARMLAIPLAACLLTACSPTDTPYIDMCQKIANNLTGGAVSSWEKNEKSAGDRALSVELAYTTSDNQQGTATCTYRKENGDYRTSPNAVTLNGEKVGAGDLMSAAVKSSGKILKEVAEETAEQAKELPEKAGELAGQAREVAEEASERAAAIASEAGEKAREVALEATKAVQEKLEKE